MSDHVRAFGWFSPEEIEPLERSPATREVLRCVLAETSFV